VDVAIIGAGGVIGRQIAVGLIQNRIVPPTSRLQLVERPGGASALFLRGFAADLRDAFAERLPELDLTFSSEDLLGDIIVVAAGATVPQDLDKLPDRNALGQANRPLFEEYARALAKHGHGEELVLVVSNPVELGVSVFCRQVRRERVIGMGGYLDTLRFRHEIAAELGVRRQAVEGLVLGEHGFGMVPCWSTVSAWGFDSPEGRQRIAALRRPAPDARSALAEMLTLVRSAGPEAAYRKAAEYPADLRTFVKPFITHITGARTPLGAAEMIIRLIDTLLSGNQALAAAQVHVAGDFLDIHGVTGVPVVLSVRGVEGIEPVRLSKEEEQAVRAAAARTAAFCAECGVRG
jgi:malate dehydrogenase